MSAAHPEPTAILRGAAVGALSAGLAFAAHGMGGGHAPTPAALVLLVAVCTGLGAVVTTLPNGSRSALVAALGSGQLLGHLALSATAHSHSVLPPLAMLAAHAAATVVCTVLVAGAEVLYGPIVRVLRVVLRSPALPTPHTHSPAVTPIHADPVDALLRASISRRGPPALV